MPLTATVERSPSSPQSGFTTLVPQDSEIFENTVHYNLTLATDAPEDIVKEALAISPSTRWLPNCRKGHLDGYPRARRKFIRRAEAAAGVGARPHRGARISSLLLLDEPTSSVDLPTEAIIFDRLFAALADKAIVASVHRLHLLPRFDHICFMERRRIAEQVGRLRNCSANAAHFTSCGKTITLPMTR